jgi:hypothetical protein
MNESDVEKIVKEYVKKAYPLEKGWKTPEIHKNLKGKGEHGIDISLYNQKKGDRYIIEVKKWDDKYPAINHNAFYSLFGQLLSRINEVPSKIYATRRKMVIAVPTQFTKLIHKKVLNVKNNKKNGMKGGWTLFGKMTNLRVWSVDMESENVTEYHWKDFLNEEL